MMYATPEVSTRAVRAVAPIAPSAPPAPPSAEAARRVAPSAETMLWLERTLQPQRRVVHEGDTIYQSGQAFTHLYLLNAGFFKLLGLAADGREQLVGLKFRGDWLGFDGIATGSYGCDAVAMDTGEVWAIRYDALLDAARREAALLPLVHAAMSREIARDRDSLMTVCSLPADARVAEFLCWWAGSLMARGLRTDRILLPLTRAEIGNYLGLTLETVSRTLSKLARDGLIGFAEKRRREVEIPDLGALQAFVQRALGPTLQ